MTISEKLQTVAENEPKVYKAGQLIVLNSSEHLKGSAFGTTISIDDISEIESALTAKLSSKNLISYPYTRSGTYTANSGTMVINADGTISLSGTPTDYCGFALVNNSDFSLPKDAIYTLSVGGNCTNVRLMVVLYGSDGTSLASLPAYPGKPVTIDMTKYTATAKWTISISRNQNNVAMTGTAYPQLEFGSIATAYEPYQRQSYTPTVAGEVTGITGLYPTTTLFTDDVGAVINCGYYKSIDKTIEKALSTQEMSIALAGGE